MAGVRYIGIPEEARRIEVPRRGDTRRHSREHRGGDAVPFDPQGETPPGMSDLAPCIHRLTGRWRVAPMPSTETVKDFFVTFALFGSPADYPPRSYADWYQLSGAVYRYIADDGTLVNEDAVDTTLAVTPTLPSEDWASPLSQEEMILVDLACRMLGGTVMRVANEERKADPDYVPVEPLARPTLERLFDRLHVNAPEPGALPTWRTMWYDRSGVQHNPKLTVFARRTDDNPYWKLRSRMAASPGGGPLAKAVGLIEPPDTFPMPLEWAEAVWDSLPADRTDAAGNERPAADVRAEHLVSLWTLTGHTAGAGQDDLIDRTQRFADDMQDVNTTMSDVLGWAGGISLISGMFLTLQIVVKTETQIVRAIDEIPPLLRLAVADDLPLNDGIVYFLDVLRQLDTTIRLAGSGEIDVDSLSSLTGVDYDGLTAIMAALGTPSSTTEPPPTRGPDPEPMVLIGDGLSDLAEIFARDWPSSETFHPYDAIFNKADPLFGVGSEAAPAVVAGQAPAAAAWTGWWNSALPTRDAGIVIEALATLLAQLVKMDDLLLAVSDLAAAEGVIGAEVRAALLGGGTGGGIDPLGGVNAADVIGLLVRQVLTDVFIDFCVANDEAAVDPQCLYPLFAWMNTEEKRTSITTALGDLRTTPEEDPWSTISRLLGFRLRLRATLLSGSRPDVDATDPGPLWTIDDPPLARVMAAENPLLADACDLGRVRDWLYHARRSTQLDVKGALEPQWTSP